MSKSEQWRDVVGYEGAYQVSNLGRVRSVDRIVIDALGRRYALKGQLLRPRMTRKYGYLAVTLFNRGARHPARIHRLVATAWIGPCPDGQQVRHGSDGRLDNSVSNLCYGTRSEDGFDKRRDGTHGGRTVRRGDGIEFMSMAVAAEESGCDRQGIWNTCNGKYRTAGGYGWEYV